MLREGLVRAEHIKAQKAKEEQQGKDEEEEVGWLSALLFSTALD